MPTLKTKRKRTVRGKLTFLPPPAPPEPGRWKVMQRHGADVLQYAWTCPTCRTTEFVLVDPPKPMSGRLRERCMGKTCAGLSGRPLKIEQE